MVTGSAMIIAKGRFLQNDFKMHMALNPMRRNVLPVRILKFLGDVVQVIPIKRQSAGMKLMGNVVLDNHHPSYAHNPP